MTFEVSSALMIVRSGSGAEYDSTLTYYPQHAEPLGSELELHTDGITGLDTAEIAIQAIPGSDAAALTGLDVPQRGHLGYRLREADARGQRWTKVGDE